MRIVSALGLTLAHLFLQAQLPAPGSHGPVPEAPVAQAVPGPSGASLDNLSLIHISEPTRPY